MRISLKFGLACDVTESVDDRPDVPILRGHPLRWAKNGHLWETCGCPECARRRAGIADSAYETVTRGQLGR